MIDNFNIQAENQSGRGQLGTSAIVELVRESLTNIEFWTCNFDLDIDEIERKFEQIIDFPHYKDLGRCSIKVHALAYARLIPTKPL